MKLVFAFGILLLAIACSFPRKAKLVDGSVIRVKYRNTPEGPVCIDSSGSYIPCYYIDKISKR
jgi:hypothetical protein